MSLPLHISWLTWGDEAGGVATALLANGALLQRLGQSVSLCSLGPGPLVEAARAQGWRVHLLGEDAGLHRRYLANGFSAMGLLHRSRILLALRRRVLDALRQHAPNVLCLPWPDLMLLAGPVCRRLGVGLVLEMPNAASRYRFDLNQRLYALAVRRWRVKLVANSDFSAERLARVPGVEVLTPAVAVDRFDPDQVQAVSREALGLPARAIVLGLMARLEASKGADLLLAAIATLRREGVALHLLIAGGPLDSAYAASLKAQALAAGLDGQVIWLGVVADPERYWPACDIAVNARRDAEPFGLSIVEAMLMQKPVVAHALGQPASSIADGRTGWLYHSPDAAALSTALRRALESRSDWPAMGREARAEALRRFAAPGCGTRYLALLRAQAAQAGAP